MAAGFRPARGRVICFVATRNGVKVPIAKNITAFAIPGYHLSKEQGQAMSYLEHRPDTCKTAQDVLEVSHKVLAWRRAHWATPARPIEPPTPVIAPEPAPEPPPIIEPPVRDWIYADPTYDRREKWPAGFISHIKSL